MTADEHIPEPEWTEFRGDVRNALLSRSVKRQSKNRSWGGGFSWNPAAAWGFSILLVFGLTAGVVLWNQNRIEPTIAEVAPIQEFLDSASTINAIAGMSQADVFDDVLRLSETETESLRLLLEDLTRKNGSLQ